jgi:hypothetical protein
LSAAAILIVKARLTLMFVPIRRILEPLPPCAGANLHGSDATRIGWAVETMSSVVPGGKNCLVRAIAGRALLARHGYAGRIRIGIGKGSADILKAHAWLECDDLIVTGAGEHRNFAAMPPFEAHSVAARSGPAS